MARGTKTVLFSILFSILTTTFGCNPFKSEHPQSKLPNEYDSNLTAQSIVAYADSINGTLGQLSKETSLVYLTGELSFYVERFKRGEQTLLLIEHSDSGGANKSLKRYYFKNDSLILEVNHTEFANESGKSYKDSRVFLRNNTVFKTENRTAANSASINTLPFIDVPLSQNTTADQTYLSNVAALNDVVEGKDKFAMVFENITTYPDSRYIILRGKIQKNYMSSILVPERDVFIDSLLDMPIIFKDKTLNIRWDVRDHEAVYVSSTR